MLKNLRAKIAEVSNLWGDELLTALSSNRSAPMTASRKNLFAKYETAFPKDYAAIYNFQNMHAHDVLKNRGNAAIQPVAQRLSFTRQP